MTDWPGDEKPLPDVILDRSDLQEAALCPHRYRLRKQLNRPVNDVLATVGTIIHELIEQAFDANEQEGTIADVADYVAEELAKQRPDLQPQVLAAGKWIANRILSINQAAIIGYELQINTTLFPATASRGTVKATACADLVMHGSMGAYEIWDWKTGWKNRTSSDARHDFQAQMLTWLWWRNVPDCNEVVFRFVQGRTGEIAEARFWRDRPVDGMRRLTQADAFEARVTEAARLILEDNDEAWPAPAKCVHCDVADVCKHCDWQATDITDDPAAFLDRYIVCTEVQKKRRAAITEWLKAGKPLTSRTCVARVKDRPSRFTWEIETL